MKKILVSINIVLILLISVSITAFAYDGNGYKVSIPTGYSSIGNNVFAMSNGNNFNIQVSKIDMSDSLFYSQKMLETYAKEVKETVFEKIKESLKQQLLSENTDGSVSEADIKQYINKMTFDGFTDKEIINVTKHNYKSLHLGYSMSLENDFLMYQEQFDIISNGKMFVITFTSYDGPCNKMTSYKDILDSFVIEEPITSVVSNKSDSVSNNSIDNSSSSQSSGMNSILLKVLGGAIGGAILGGIGCFISSMKKKKKAEKNETVIETVVADVESTQSNESIQEIKDQSICKKCREIVPDGYKFCIKCGEKVD